MSLSTQPVCTLDTKFGPIKVTFTDASHAAVYTDENRSGSTPGFLTFRGQEFRVSAHLYADNDWAPGEHTPSVTKRVFGSGPSARTHREAIVAEVIAVVREFAQANPQMLVQAQRFRLESDLFSAQAEENEANTAYQLAQEKRQVIEAKLLALQG